jgi:hypothetical protein
VAGLGARLAALLPHDRRVHLDQVLPAIGGEHQVIGLGDQGSGDPRQVRDGAKILAVVQSITSTASFAVWAT